jgi:phosphatidyl-myo-inositol dimannoside synthase
MKSGRGARVLALVTDAYGGTGGIAQYNRDFMESVASHPAVREVVVVPRVIARDTEPLPPKVTHEKAVVDSKLRFMWKVGKLAGGKDKFDLVICAHINLLPVAYFAARRCNARLLLMVYGLEVWIPGRYLRRYMLHRTDAIVAISALTVKRLREWAVIAGDRIFLIPNAIDLSLYSPGKPAVDIRKELNIGTGPVIMTLGRMDASERAKGFDEVLEAMPSLVEDFPTLAYVLAGDGSDRARLESKARKLGLGDRTVFTGYVPEEKKLDLYRAMDLFVMPSRLEGFGYVFLEALASGIPVVASSVDGSREAVRGGAWGSLADPNNRDEIIRAIRDGLTNPVVPHRVELEYFSKERFRGRVWKALDRVLNSDGLKTLPQPRAGGT